MTGERPPVNVSASAWRSMHWVTAWRMRVSVNQKSSRRLEGGAGINAKDDLLDDPGRSDVLDQLAIGHRRVQRRQGVEWQHITGQHVTLFVPLRQRPRLPGQETKG